MTLETDKTPPLWRQGLWLGLAWGAIEVGVSRWAAPLPHLPALAEIALSVLVWTIVAGILGSVLRLGGTRGKAAGPFILIGLFFSVGANLLIHPFLFSGVLLLSRAGLLYTLWFTVLLLIPAAVAMVVTRGAQYRVSPVMAVCAAVLMASAFAFSRTSLPGWPAVMPRVYSAVALAGIAEIVALFLTVRTAHSIRWSRPTPAVVLLVVLLFPVPHRMRDPLRRAVTVTAPAQAPPVVLISLDTTRPDHLSYFGYSRPTSPNLDRFLASCRVFPSAYATSPWTLPSHASVFTGLYPRTHGAHYAPASPVAVPPQPLDPRTGTLAEHFQDQGYITAAIAANQLAVSPWLGMDRGFELVAANLRLPDRPLPLNFLRSAARVLRNRPVWRFARIHHDAVEITDRAGAWIARNRDRPFFLFVNYLDPHRPYAPPISALPASDRMSTRDRLRWSLSRVTDDDPNFDAYDGELRHMDAALGDFLEELETTGLMDRAIIIVFSDHGEFFGELGLTGHGRDVHEAVLRAVLAIRMPGGAHAGVDSTLATIADVPSLLMDALQGRIPCPGAPAGPRILGEMYLTRRNMRRAPRFPDSPHLVAVREGDYKLIDHGDGHALFNVVADPREETDLADTHPEIAERLLQSLRVWETDTELAPLNPDDSDHDQLRETLKGLGYFQ